MVLNMIHKMGILVIIAFLICLSLSVRIKRQNHRIRAQRIGATNFAAGSTGVSSTTTISPDFTRCVRGCPITSEYNPVCGSNQISYQNENSLRCARQCGLDVRTQYVGNCPS